MLAFSLGDVWFGVRVEEAAGLVGAERLVPLPHQRLPLAGILAFRGTMVPAFDLASYLGIDSRGGSGSGYTLVLTRGSDRFGVVIPVMPCLIPARDLRETEISEADSELASMIETAFESGERRIHCLNYWSIIESITPLVAESCSAAAGN